MEKVIFIEGEKNSGKSNLLRSATSKLLLTGLYDVIYSHDTQMHDSFFYVLKKKDQVDFYKYTKEFTVEGCNAHDQQLVPEYTKYFIINSSSDEGTSMKILDLRLKAFKNLFATTDLTIITSIRPSAQGSGLNKKMKDCVRGIYPNIVDDTIDIKNLTFNQRLISDLWVLP